MKTESVFSFLRRFFHRKPERKQTDAEYRAWVREMNRRAEADGQCYDIHCYDDTPHARHT